MQLGGLHHLTAISADARGNHDFYTRVLGMRLVKKTVNQDQVSAYHLFYADGVGSPGTDLTFFDFPTGPERRGTRSIVRTGLRVAGPDALAYWVARLDAAAVPHGDVRITDGRPEMELEDPEGQRLALIESDRPPAHLFQPWASSPVPEAMQVCGLGPITISVPALRPTDQFLVQVLAMRSIRQYSAPDASGIATHVYETGAGGPDTELHVRIEPGLPAAAPGAGGAHHVAFRIRDDEYDGWVERLRQLGVRSSGAVDRFWFRSLYAREPNGILFEIATEGPGFAADEPVERLGERLVLPPFLEPERARIEQGLKPL